MIDTVPDVRTGADELFPTLSLGGRWLSCVERTPAGQRLRIYDRKEGRWLVPAIEADTECRTPFMSPLGGRVVFATPVDGQLDLRVYDVLLHRDVTPPYLNSAGDEALASFSLDGTQLVFSSNRREAPGLYLADLDSGVVQPLVLTDAPAGRQYAYFIGLDESAVVSTRTGELGCFAYRLDSQVLDTLPFCGKGLPGGPPGIVAAELLPAKGDDLVEVLSAGGAGQDPEAHPAAPSDAARQEAPEPTFGLREAGDVSTPVAGRPDPESILVCP